MRRRPRQAAGGHKNNHSRWPAMLACQRGRQARPPVASAADPNRRPSRLPGKPATSLSRRTGSTPVARDLTVPQDQRHPGGPGNQQPPLPGRTNDLPQGPVVPKPPETARQAGFRESHVLEPAGPPLSPYRPPCPRAGRGHCRAGPAPVLTWLASPCRTGDGPDLLPNRLPGAAGCRLCVCSTACYGLTPRSRVVKR